MNVGPLSIMPRTERNFADNPEWLRQWMVDNNWCDRCNEADIGLHEPREYEEDEKRFLEGKCVRCGGLVVSEIVESSEDDG